MTEPPGEPGPVRESLPQRLSSEEEPNTTTLLPPIRDVKEAQKGKREMKDIRDSLETQPNLGKIVPGVLFGIPLLGIGIAFLIFSVSNPIGWISLGLSLFLLVPALMVIIQSLRSEDTTATNPSG